MSQEQKNTVLITILTIVSKVVDIVLKFLEGNKVNA